MKKSKFKQLIKEEILKNLKKGSIKEWSIFGDKFKSNRTFVNSEEDEEWGSKIDDFIYDIEPGGGWWVASGFGQNNKYITFAVEPKISTERGEKHFHLDKKSGEIKEM